MFSLKSNILWAMALCCTLAAEAKPRTQAQIMQLAGDALAARMNNVRHSAVARPLSVAYSTESLTVVQQRGGGYAVISNDDLLPAVLAYSPSAFSPTDANPGLKWWLAAVEEAAKDIVASGVPFRSVTPDTNTFPDHVPQMLSSVWGQMEPYNNFCPLEYDATGKLVGRTVVGCVATAMAQIMYYHKYPTQPTGTYTDMQTTDAFGRPVPITVNLDDYTFDYSLMQDSYTPGNYSQATADQVAALSYACGVSFAMIYGTGASGTYSDSAVVSLKAHFGFPNAQLLDRSTFTDGDDVWMNIIFNELSHNRPLMYSGVDDIWTVGGGGHAFVFDGYDAEGLVHVNWGWYGRNDGYYAVDLLNPRIHSFHNQQDMIIGCESPSQASVRTDTLRVEGDVSADSLRSYAEKSRTQGLRFLDLSKATLPGDSLPTKIFYGSLLQKIVLPASLTTLGDGVFADCRNLSEVEFGDNDERHFVVADNVVYTADTTEVIEVLPYYYNAASLMADYNSVFETPATVRKIHRYALDGCFRIQGLVLSQKVEHIGSSVFAHATNLRRICLRTSTPPTVDVRAFDGLDIGYTQLAIPAGTRDVYSRSAGWRDFFRLDNVVEQGTNIRATDVYRHEGEENPEWQYRVLGDFVSGEPTLSCEAGKDSPAGDYPIRVERGTIEGENVVFTNGTLHVVDKSVQLPTTGIHAPMFNSKDRAFTLGGCAVSGKLPSGVHEILIINGKKVVR